MGQNKCVENLSLATQLIEASLFGTLHWKVQKREWLVAKKKFLSVQGSRQKSDFNATRNRTSIGATQSKVFSAVRSGINEKKPWPPG